MARGFAGLMLAVMLLGTALSDKVNRSTEDDCLGSEAGVLLHDKAPGCLRACPSLCPRVVAGVAEALRGGRVPLEALCREHEKALACATGPGGAEACAPALALAGLSPGPEGLCPGRGGGAAPSPRQAAEFAAGALARRGDAGQAQNMDTTVEKKGNIASVGAKGDPHLQNVHGERFDLMKAGTHVLINIPRKTNAEHALLRVQADARQLGGHCADMYFQEVNVTGSWAEAKQIGGYQYSVSQHDIETPGWVVFGRVALKIVHGHTDSGLRYLNVYAKHLGRAGFAVGGLLGEDDHEDVITPPAACAKKVSLLQIGKGAAGLPRMRSVAVASLA